MVRLQQTEQIVQEVCARDCKAKFNQNRLQKLFCRLLAMETDNVMFGRPTLTESFGDPIIALRLADPLGCELLHTESCLYP